MIKTKKIEVDDCVHCETCRGRGCPNAPHIELQKVLTCDVCDEEKEKVANLDGFHACKDCIDEYGSQLFEFVTMEEL
ncbi:MAG: hypothetical protein IJZ64_06815 [Ruminococcus sp.]|nr:hypothetical protein [Ruminococcus sp.]